MADRSTGDLLRILNAAAEREELETYLNSQLCPGRRDTIAAYFGCKLRDKGLSKKQVVRSSGIHRTYAYQILQGAKHPSRSKIIALGIGMGLTLEEMQKGLAIAGSGSLYPRVRRDAVLIFALNKGLDILETNALLFDLGEEILE